MSHQVFYNVDLADWVYGTIEKCKRGVSWEVAWNETYREIGGCKTSGEKGCPRIAAKTLYEFGRLKNGGLPYKACEIPELWDHSKNGTYAILATRLLCENPHLNKASLWRRVQEAVRREVGHKPARSNQDGPSLVYQLWHLGLIAEGPLYGSG